MKEARRKLILVAVAVALLAAPVLRPTAAGTLPADILALFPKEVGEVAYADLREARKLSWFAQLKEQMLPPRFRQFEQFLAAAGMDPNSQVHELAWGLVAPTQATGEQIVGVALGQFSPQATEDYFKQQKLPIGDLRGFPSFAYGSGQGPHDILFVFIDSNTAAFGHRALLEKLIDVRYGAAEGLLRNDQLYPLVGEVNGNGLVWAVLDQTYTRIAMRQLLPQSAQLPEAAKLAEKIQALTIRVQAAREVDARFSAVCENPEDANLLAAVLQAGLLYRRYQAQQSGSELVQLLDAAQVLPRGERMEVSINLKEETMREMIRNNAFAFRMPQ